MVVVSQPHLSSNPRPPPPPCSSWLARTTRLPLPPHYLHHLCPLTAASQGDALPPPDPPPPPILSGEILGQEVEEPALLTRHPPPLPRQHPAHHLPVLAPPAGRGGGRRAPWQGEGGRPGADALS